MTADLPVRAAAPVDYVRTCPNAPIGGTGFFVIPGTETCLQISGYVRTEYRFLENNTRTSLNTRDQSDLTFFARARIALDARTATEFGTLRSFFSIHANSSAGFTDLAQSNATELDHGFIQFAGLTAGRITSFFDFFGGNLLGGGLQSDTTTELLAYTATFGSGFSATISIENALNRRVENSVDWNYGGQELPDLVANLNVAQAWGSAQIMGALHQIRHDGTTSLAMDDELGWALGAGVNIRLPMIAAGDQLWLQAVYADGALGYLNTNGRARFESIGVNASDAIYFAGPARLETTTGFLITAAFRHFWTPTFWQDIQASYAEIDSPVDSAGVVSYAQNFNQDFSTWQVGTRLNWRPVAGLTFSGDIVYTAVDTDRPVDRVGGRPAIDDDSIWQGRLRIQRDF